MKKVQFFHESAVGDQMNAEEPEVIPSTAKEETALIERGILVELEKMCLSHNFDGYKLSSGIISWRHQEKASTKFYTRIHKGHIYWGTFIADLVDIDLADLEKLVAQFDNDAYANLPS